MEPRRDTLAVARAFDGLRNDDGDDEHNVPISSNHLSVVADSAAAAAAVGGGAATAATGAGSAAASEALARSRDGSRGGVASDNGPVSARDGDNGLSGGLEEAGAACGNILGSAHLLQQQPRNNNTNNNNNNNNVTAGADIHSGVNSNRGNPTNANANNDNNAAVRGIASAPSTADSDALQQQQQQQQQQRPQEPDRVVAVAQSTSAAAHDGTPLGGMAGPAPLADAGDDGKKPSAPQGLHAILSSSFSQPTRFRRYRRVSRGLTIHTGNNYNNNDNNNNNNNDNAIRHFRGENSRTRLGAQQEPEEQLQLQSPSPSPPRPHQRFASDPTTTATTTSGDSGGRQQRAPPPPPPPATAGARAHAAAQRRQAARRETHFGRSIPSAKSSASVVVAPLTASLVAAVAQRTSCPAAAAADPVADSTGDGFHPPPQPVAASSSTQLLSPTSMGRAVAMQRAPQERADDDEHHDHHNLTAGLRNNHSAERPLPQQHPPGDWKAGTPSQLLSLTTSWPRGEGSMDILEESNRLRRLQQQQHQQQQHQLPEWSSAGYAPTTTGTTPTTWTPLTATLTGADWSTSVPNMPAFLTASSTSLLFNRQQQNFTNYYNNNNNNNNERRQNRPNHHRDMLSVLQQQQQLSGSYDPTFNGLEISTDQRSSPDVQSLATTTTTASTATTGTGMLATTTSALSSDAVPHSHPGGYFGRHGIATEERLATTVPVPRHSTAHFARGSTKPTARWPVCTTASSAFPPAVAGACATPPPRDITTAPAAEAATEEDLSRDGHPRPASVGENADDSGRGSVSGAGGAATTMTTAERSSVMARSYLNTFSSVASEEVVRTLARGMLIGSHAVPFAAAAMGGETSRYPSANNNNNGDGDRVSEGVTLAPQQQQEPGGHTPITRRSIAPASLWTTPSRSPLLPSTTSGQQQQRSRRRRTSRISVGVPWSHGSPSFIAQVGGAAGLGEEAAAAVAAGASPPIGPGRGLPPPSYGFAAALPDRSAASPRHRIPSSTAATMLGSATAPGSPPGTFLRSVSVVNANSSAPSEVFSFSNTGARPLPSSFQRRLQPFLSAAVGSAATPPTASPAAAPAAPAAAAAAATSAVDIGAAATATEQQQHQEQPPTVVTREAATAAPPPPPPLALPQHRTAEGVKTSDPLLLQPFEPFPYSSSFNGDGEAAPTPAPMSPAEAGTVGSGVFLMPLCAADPSATAGTLSLSSSLALSGRFRNLLTHDEHSVAASPTLPLSSASARARAAALSRAMWANSPSNDAARSHRTIRTPFSPTAKGSSGDSNSHNGAGGFMAMRLGQGGATTFFRVPPFVRPVDVEQLLDVAEARLKTAPVDIVHIFNGGKSLRARALRQARRQHELHQLADSTTTTASTTTTPTATKRREVGNTLPTFSARGHEPKSGAAGGPGSSPPSSTAPPPALALPLPSDASSAAGDALCGTTTSSLTSLGQTRGTIGSMDVSPSRAAPDTSAAAATAGTLRQ